MHRIPSSSLLASFCLLLLASSCKGPGGDEPTIASSPAFPVQEKVTTTADPSSAVALDGVLTDDAAERKELGENYAQMAEQQKPDIRDYYILLSASGRRLTGDNGDSDETFGTGGINLMAAGPGDLFHWDLAYSYGTNNDTTTVGGLPTTIQSSIWEIDAGLVKIIKIGSAVRPYIGAGVAYLRGAASSDSTVSPFSFADNTFGGYARAGVMFDITDWGGIIGLDVRYVGGTSISSGQSETDIDGIVGSFTLGFSW